MTDLQTTEAPKNGVADFDFAHLFVDKATAWFDLPWLGPEAALEMRPSTGENKQYTEAMLSISGERQANRIIHSSKPTAEDADLEREEDKAIYPGTVIIGWRGIRNTAGDLVEWSIEACHELLKQLPNWIVLKIRLFALSPDNFIRSPAAKLANPATVAKNS